MDRTLGGKRCQTVRNVAHHRGILPRQTSGTIRYAVENIGRTLLHVDFDSGAGYWCWRWPEESLDYFHDYETGFAGRVRIQ